MNLREKAKTLNKEALLKWKTEKIAYKLNILQRLEQTYKDNVKEINNDIAEIEKKEFIPDTSLRMDNFTSTISNLNLTCN